MSDRVRMKATTVFHNPLIETHLRKGELRAQPHTVQDGDEFSTGEAHAQELERAGFARRINGEAVAASSRAAGVTGFQTTAAASRAAEAAGKAAAEKAAAELDNKMQLGFENK